MNIELQKIRVRDLVADYADNEELGVRAYGGKLDVRPPYQREFVYKDKQRDAVVDTVIKGFPLNVMYWAVQDDGGFEVIDGQQRTISLCQYVDGDFSVAIGDHQLAFHNLQTDQQDQILDYELMVYHCTGTDSEKLEWFRIINIAGEKLTDQELRNAVYHGPWVTDAKKFFSKTGGPAFAIGSKYLSGVANRQEYLETAIKWINAGKIEPYMIAHQHDASSNPIRLHFSKVIAWVEATFPKYRAEMKGIDWGSLYAAHHGDELDPVALEAEVARLMADDDVTAKRGIYTYVLNGQEKHLNIRAFNARERREAYENQKGICPACGEHFEIEQMQADHKTPWSKGGKTSADNCVMLCAEDNRKKWDV